MTMRYNGQVSYRHFWEKGFTVLAVIGWEMSHCMARIRYASRNFTRRLTLVNHTTGASGVEYELWTENVQLGRYILNVEINH